MENKPLIQLFEENELNISALYSLYAQNLPYQKKFWSRLSNEEISHAAQIGTEKHSLDAIEDNNFSRGVIRFLMEFVLAQIEKAQGEHVSHPDALKTALKIEQSMLEKNFFDVFSTSNEKVKKVFENMNIETKHHIEVIQNEMKKK